MGGGATSGETQPLIVDRWKRYGKDRLYVSRGSEVKVGWWDLLSGEAHPETPADLAVLTTAVAHWRSGEAGDDVVVDAPVAEMPEATPQSLVGHDARVLDYADTPAQELATNLVERPWLDLATNDAGAAAREQALGAKETAPVRTFLARALGVHTEERAWRIGADGEEKVAAQLVKVIKKDPRWRVIHAIPVGTRGSDIDHLVIGPGGVFTVNAKHHPGAKIWVGGSTFLVNGHKQPYIRNSRHEAARAAKLLTEVCGFSVHVEGVVVTVNAKDIVVKKAPNGVHVVPRMQVAKWLSRHGDIHPEPVLETIYDAARRSTTWR